MIKHKLFSIVLVIITILITNFSFAIVAKDAFVPALDNTVMMENAMHNGSVHIKHNSNNNFMECEIYCDALMMSCVLGINSSNNSEFSHSHTIIKKLNVFSDDALYSVDLIQDHKPPIFS
ncbi:Hypothetical protein F387_02006 [Wohlfahrtiimonas chitiniclastica SH04]|uniref:Uncharacterized protein n=2 Tax=Wohlfahrtiimonas chitiniclastica TaxID=400946 RepID=L8XWP5_9GAMM|nr:hypothetical protein [Wohlfahrtiimonas chitiniclastica]ELV07175.1 Hypothetical protein F387_02006 [Wohlfahrtiimonas chitiniclastica SH04]KZX37297.1 hypothetical protein A6V30_10025 [Wohlfahrtiimonas chitiniclastica]MBS7825496.1 hypothetical protein [Wohlfahrtiimonas chitiniclastica]MBS7839180.1 hypothetical protein [Wohlfahrtiimonas chitiniclastica]MBS7841118.1 hypothetical protein [Wohlfahrtiimonas chitiniclastica]